jgi:uncharacterized membrane protein
VADLLAIGYPDETTAAEAAKEAQRLAQELVIEPEAIAVLVRDKEGKFHITTTHHEVAVGTVSGMFWGLLFGILFFIPVLGMAVGAALGALFGLAAKLDISEDFQRQVRDMLKPGTSALFLVVDKMTTDKAIAALGRFGGTVLKTSLPEDVERQIQEALHGTPATSRV